MKHPLRSFLPAALAALTLLGSAPAQAQTATQAWATRYNGPDDYYDYGIATAVDAAGNVVITGQSYNRAPNYDPDIYTAKYAAATGALVWERRYDGGINDAGHAVAVDSLGNVVIAGVSRAGNGNDFYVAKYAAADGALIWEQRYDSPSNGHDTPNALALDANDNVIVAGSSVGPNSEDYLTLKYSAAGALLWERRYDGPANGADTARALAVDAAGNVTVTGESPSGSPIALNYDFYTAKYAAADGAVLWERRYDGAAQGYDVAVAVAVDAAGNAAVVGSSSSVPGNVTNQAQLVTVKYAANGALLWEAKHARVGDYASDVAMDAAGNVTIAGVTGFFRCVTRYAANGALAWERFAQITPADGINVKVELDAAGNAVAASHGYGPGGGVDYSVTKYAAATGAVLWQGLYDGGAAKDVPGTQGGNLTGHQLALTTDGGAVVTGYSQVDSGTPWPDIATVRFAPPVVATLTVTNTNDSGAGSLRAALAAADSGDTIEFAPGVTGTITLTSGELLIAQDVTIAGPGAATLAISGNDASRVLHIAPGKNVAISGLTIRDGRTANGSDGVFPGAGEQGGDGGGVLNEGALVMSACVVQNNRTGSGGDSTTTFFGEGIDGGRGGNGGGICANETATFLALYSCVIEGNTTGGGGLGTGGPTPGTFYNPSVGTGGTGGAGGGVYVGACPASIISCTVRDNVTGNGGPGGDAAQGASGGSGGSGGGVCLFVYSGSEGPVSISGCTVSGNATGNGNRGGDNFGSFRGGGGSGGNGGGLAYDSRAVALTDSTISGNTTGNGGPGGDGVSNPQGFPGSGNVGGSGGTGGGLAAGNALRLMNTILAGNGTGAGGAAGSGGSSGTAGLAPDLSSSGAASRGHNLVGKNNDSGFGFIASDLSGTAASPLDPLLGALADNGGVTFTHLPLPGSPVVEAGNGTAGGTDQRGLPRRSGNFRDIGSIELPNPVPVLIAPAPGALTGGTIAVSYSLPVQAAAGSVVLSFTSGAGTVSLTLGSAGESAGTHSLSVAAANPGASPLVASVSGGAIADGIHTVKISYQGTAGYAAVFAAAENVTIDTTAPVLTLPGTITVWTTDPAGRAVTYAPSAADALDPAPVLVVAPPSGSLFAVGTTTVNVSATDWLGHVANGSFNVTVGLLLAANDSDGDGLNDAAELNMAALGFDWQVAQPALVATYFANANTAGLHTQAQFDANRTAGRSDVLSAPNTYSLYTLDQVQTLHADVPLLTRGAGGVFTLTIGVQKTTNLASGFSPFPFEAPQTSINGEGKIEFQFTVPDNSAFFRVVAD